MNQEEFQAKMSQFDKELEELNGPIKKKLEGIKRRQLEILAQKISNEAAIKRMRIAIQEAMEVLRKHKEIRPDFCRTDDMEKIWERLGRNYKAGLRELEIQIIQLKEEREQIRYDLIIEQIAWQDAVNERKQNTKEIWNKKHAFIIENGFQEDVL